jgi:hypothetical protein
MTIICPACGGAGYLLITLMGALIPAPARTFAERALVLACGLPALILFIAAFGLFWLVIARLPSLLKYAGNDTAIKVKHEGYKALGYDAMFNPGDCAKLTPDIN